MVCLVLTALHGDAVGGDEPKAADATGQAAEILKAAGVRGGLVVHLGCGDGKLTAALRATDSYLVHGLDTDAAQIEQARRHIASRGLYGPVSAERWNGNRLPYIDNAVNLLVVSGPLSVAREELLRVLSPSGVAVFTTDHATEKGTGPICRNGPEGASHKLDLSPFRSVKPRPQELDEWTHYLHDPTNNAVSHDTVVDPPRHLQWVAGPKWSRHHDHMSSSSAIVSAGGRNFYIFDEATNLSIQLPSRWTLIARDAFSGVLLWKRPIASWHTQLWRLKSGPASLPRRLVAIGDVVYVTLSYDGPVAALEAASGRTLRTYAQTQGTEEILVSDGVLFVVAKPSAEDQPLDPKGHNYDFSESPRTILAIQAETGQVLWRQPWKWVVPGTLTVDAQRVLLYDGQNLICLDRKTGEKSWQTASVGGRTSVPSYFSPTLVSYNGVVLFSGSDPAAEDYHKDNGRTLQAYDAATGKRLWTAPSPPSGYRSPEDILVVDGLAWTTETMFGNLSGKFTGRDPRTGEVKSEFPPDVDTHWFHHRCYRAKATDKYILASRTGIEFVDVKEKHWICHHWVRGACLYGVMPANGMVYTSPHPCACYLEAKLFGFNALAPARSRKDEGQRTKDEDRLEKGTAYQISNLKSQISDSADWPTYRHDPVRSGFTKAAVSPDLKPAWERKMGGRLSSVVIAEGKLFVAAVDAHTVHALTADSGEPVWSFTAGGRVDSPPTIWQGRVLFGSADGWVYCLRATDGVLMWRFRAAPAEQRMVAFDQVESVWPVHGSVLVQDGVLWCVAGRSMYLDGGLRLLRLDPATGKKVGETVLDDRDPDSGRNLQVRLKGLNMPVALNDILSSDGRHVYMRSQRFDLEGQRLAIDTPTGRIQDQQGEAAHLFCPTGFLDDAYWHRSYWVYGLRWASGAGGYFLAGRFAPSGRLLVFDDQTVYGFSRKPQYFRWTTPLERQLFACAKQPEIIRSEPKPESKPAEGARKKAQRAAKADAAAKQQASPEANAKTSDKPATPPKEQPAAKKKAFNAGAQPDARVAYQWTQQLPIHVRGLVLADRTLFVAGPPDVVDEEASLKTFADPATQEKLAEQAAALEGKQGSLLLAVSATDGTKLTEFHLDSLPVFDGLAAAGGKLYLATTDGRIVCFGTPGNR
jgi:outer membrane protein assembly factor BamB